MNAFAPRPASTYSLPVVLTSTTGARAWARALGNVNVRVVPLAALAVPMPYVVLVDGLAGARRAFELARACPPEHLIVFGDDIEAPPGDIETVLACPLTVVATACSAALSWRDRTHGPFVFRTARSLTSKAKLIAVVEEVVRAAACARAPVGGIEE